MPVAFKLLASENGFVHVCGHRGHSIGAPENTLAALTATRDNGGTSAEIDVPAHGGRRDRAPARRFSRPHEHGPRPAVADGVEGHAQARRRLMVRSAIRRASAYRRLSRTAEHAKKLGLGLVTEIKEERQIERMLDVWRSSSRRATSQTTRSSSRSIIPWWTAEAARAKGPDRGDHACAACRYGRCRTGAKLNSLSIEHGMFNAEDAGKLHQAGVAIRMHIPPPEEYSTSTRRPASIGGPRLQRWMAGRTDRHDFRRRVGYIAELVASAGGGAPRRRRAEICRKASPVPAGRLW